MSPFTGLAESRHTSQRCYVNPFCGSFGSCLQPDDVPRVTSFQSALVLGGASADICNFSSLLWAHEPVTTQTPATTSSTWVFVLLNGVMRDVAKGSVGLTSFITCPVILKVYKSNFATVLSSWIVRFEMLIPQAVSSCWAGRNQAATCNFWFWKSKHGEATVSWNLSNALTIKKQMFHQCTLYLRARLQNGVSVACQQQWMK